MSEWQPGVIAPPPLGHLTCDSWKAVVGKRVLVRRWPGDTEVHMSIFCDCPKEEILEVEMESAERIATDSMLKYYSKRPREHKIACPHMVITD